MIKHIRGDITDADVDIIVVPIDTTLNHDHNNYSKMVAKTAGYGLVLEASSIKHVDIGDIGMTKGGNLKAKNVYHIPTIDIGSNVTISYEDLEKVWRKALTWCKANQFESIAAPLIGADSGLDSEKVRDILIKVGSEYQFDNIEVIIVEHKEF